TTLYSNPLPHVLILTAIVVGVATTALGLAIAVRIYEAYESVDEEDIAAMDIQDRQRDNAVTIVTDTKS
ncbi:MAG: NADH-quinone oxidoreductase subunit K, partial [Pseudomonadota bacterium]